jgi:hypothetical protein
MASVYYWKRGDTAPALQTPLDDGAGMVLDIPDHTTVLFRCSQEGAITPLIAAAAQVVDVDDHREVLYTPGPQDSDLPQGIYRVEWQVTWGDDGRITTFPNDGYDFLVITDTLAA